MNQASTAYPSEQFVTQTLPTYAKSFRRKWCPACRFLRGYRVKQTQNCKFCGRSNKISKKKKVKSFLVKRIMGPCCKVLAILNVDVDFVKENVPGNKRKGPERNLTRIDSVVESVKNEIHKCESLKCIHQFFDTDGLPDKNGSHYGSKSSISSKALKILGKI